MGRLGLLLAVLVFSVLVCVAAPRAARAEVESGVALQTFHGVMVARTVRDLSSPNVATDPMFYLSVAGAVSAGPLLGGISVGGAYGLAAYRFDGFAGAFVGGEVGSGPLGIRLVGEGGLHVVVGAGGDLSGSSDAPTVVLPFVGVRAAVERRLGFARRILALGGSAFVRVDEGRRDVSGSKMVETCSLICGTVPVKTSLEVGGAMIGVGVSLTFDPTR